MSKNRYQNIKKRNRGKYHHDDIKDDVVVEILQKENDGKVHLTLLPKEFRIILEWYWQTDQMDKDMEELTGDKRKYSDDRKLYNRLIKEYGHLL